MADDTVTAGIDLAKKALEVTYPDALQPAAKEFGTAAAPAGKELAKVGVTLAKTINLNTSRQMRECCRSGHQSIILSRVARGVWCNGGGWT